MTQYYHKRYSKIKIDVMSEALDDAMQMAPSHLILCVDIAILHDLRGDPQMDADRRRIVGASDRSPLPAKRFAYLSSHLGLLYEEPVGRIRYYQGLAS